MAVQIRVVLTQHDCIKYDFTIKQTQPPKRSSDGTTPIDLAGTTAEMQAWDTNQPDKLIDCNTATA
jgi:hypothetical protein